MKLQELSKTPEEGMYDIRIRMNKEEADSLSTIFKCLSNYIMYCEKDKTFELVEDKEETPSKNSGEAF